MATAITTITITKDSLGYLATIEDHGEEFAKVSTGNPFRVLDEAVVYAECVLADEEPDA